MNVKRELKFVQVFYIAIDAGISTLVRMESYSAWICQCQTSCSFTLTIRSVQLPWSDSIVELLNSNVLALYQELYTYQDRWKDTLNDYWMIKRILIVCKNKFPLLRRIGVHNILAFLSTIASMNHLFCISSSILFYLSFSSSFPSLPSFLHVTFFVHWNHSIVLTF